MGGRRLGGIGGSAREKWGEEGGGGQEGEGRRHCKWAGRRRAHVVTTGLQEVETAPLKLWRVDAVLTTCEDENGSAAHSAPSVH